MVLGDGVAPFRGGPLRMADMIGLTRVVGELDALRRDSANGSSPPHFYEAKAGEGRGFYSERAPPLNAKRHTAEPTGHQ